MGNDRETGSMSIRIGGFKPPIVIKVAADTPDEQLPTLVGIAVANRKAADAKLKRLPCGTYRIADRDVVVGYTGTQFERNKIGIYIPGFKPALILEVEDGSLNPMPHHDFVTDMLSLVVHTAIEVRQASDLENYQLAEMAKLN